MIEYPSIQNSSKAPRKKCIVFEKMDGSNFRAKWTQKRGFDVYGTRTQLIDETTPMWGEMVTVFKSDAEEKFHEYFKKYFKNEREIIVFGEFLGENSFAGRHEQEPHKIVFFDVLVGNKNRKFMLPQEFMKIQKYVFVDIPRVIYTGNLNEELIKQVRNDEFNTPEGVICKGTEYVGNASGGVWMAKIKTQAYLDKLKARLGDEWEKYAE